MSQGQNLNQHYTINHASYWRAERDQYLVEPASRDPVTGKLFYSTADRSPNRWVIIREVRDDAALYESPSSVLIAEFRDYHTADMIRDLIVATAIR